MHEEKKVTHNIPSLNKRITALENAGPAESIGNELDLFARIQKLEQCIAKMAHYNGGANERILREFNIDTYLLKKEDMSKAG